MKKKILLFLLVAAGFQSVQAMSSARKFAHQVFRSKTALGAAVLAGGIGTYSASNFYEIAKKIDGAESSLPEPIQERLRIHFRGCGVSDIKIFDLDLPGHVPSPVTFHTFGRVAVGLPLELRLALMGAPEAKLTVDEVMAILEHEASHLRHRDALKRAIVMSMIPSGALMVAKATRVTGSNKKLAAVSGLASWAGMALAQRWYWREMVEQRCDDEVAPENSGHLASGIGKILPTVREQMISIYDRNAAANQKPLYEDLDSGRKDHLGKRFDKLEFMNGMVADHPSVECRTERAQMRAHEYRSEVMQRLLEELRTSTRGVKLHLATCTWNPVILKFYATSPRQLLSCGMGCDKEHSDNQDNLAVDSHICLLQKVYKEIEKMDRDEFSRWLDEGGVEFEGLHKEFKRDVQKLVVERKRK